MKRHPALAPLSRDHHHTLLIAAQLRRATERTAQASANMFLAQWEAEERLHFRMEEELLLPAYAEHGQLDHPAIMRMLLDHVAIRGMAARLSCAHTDLLHELGERLSEHVRLEEREVFPLIEAAMPEPELHALGERLAASAP